MKLGAGEFQPTGTLELMYDPPRYRFGSERPGKIFHEESVSTLIYSKHGRLYADIKNTLNIDPRSSYFLVISGTSGRHHITDTGSDIYYIADFGTAAMVAHDMVCEMYKRGNVSPAITGPAWFKSLVGAIRAMSGGDPLNFSKDRDHSGVPTFVDFDSLFDYKKSA